MPGIPATTWQVRPAPQVTPQAPQLPSTLRVTSQPSALDPLQLPKPGWQVMPQPPPTQTATEFCGVTQTLPQVPQWVAVVLVLVSQPLAAIPSQLPKPMLQAVSYTHLTLPTNREV